MGKKLNTLTQEQAEKIWDGRPKLPEKKILTFAHKQVFVNEQYFFKHKECGHRYGYCTACGKDVQIDIENMRLWTDKHAACRSARHNDTVCCPACGHEVLRDGWQRDGPAAVLDRELDNAFASGLRVTEVFAYPEFENRVEAILCRRFGTLNPVGNLDLLDDTERSLSLIHI